MTQFVLQNDRRPSAAPSLFAANERRKQKMLLSGLDCLSGQLDLFDVDAFPKETDKPCDSQTSTVPTA
jgi:hypothetical protein